MKPLYPMKAAVQATARKREPADVVPAGEITATSTAPSKTPGTTIRKPATAAAKPAVHAEPVRGRRLQVRKSGVHGKGVFAVQPIKKGERFIEYIGEVISWPEALRRHPHDPDQPDHTFYFHLDDDRVIDGLVGGNASRWINHACAPNCEADDADGRVWLVALRNIKVDEELFFDYGLVIEERYTPALKKRFECRCGAKTCRGTMLAPKTETKAADAKPAPAKPVAKPATKPGKAVA